jgi:hypothetical protein
VHVLELLKHDQVDAGARRVEPELAGTNHGGIDVEGGAVAHFQGSPVLELTETVNLSGRLATVLEWGGSELVLLRCRREGHTAPRAAPRRLHHAHCSASAREPTK